PVPPETPTLSLHDALPIWHRSAELKLHGPAKAELAAVGCVLRRVDYVSRSLGDGNVFAVREASERILRGLLQIGVTPLKVDLQEDRKSTRLNSSHVSISYA